MVINVFSKEELIDFLRDDKQNEKILVLADEVRKKYVGDKVHLRGLIEFSNYCKCFCSYCGIRCENQFIDRYRLTEQEIINNAKLAIDLGYKTIVLQSGEDNYFDRNTMCKIITEIKKQDVALTLSIGERTYDDYQAFKDCGADRYLLRIETSDKALYERLHPYMSFENRLECLKNIKKLGYETGTGCLVGLPNQTIESLADDILFFKELGADMIGVGPFLPHHQTPLKEEKQGSFNLALKVMALTRIMLKDINIPATTAMETIHPNGRLIALQSGANVVMPNVTSVEYRKKYEIYPNKAGLNEDSKEYKSDIEKKIKSIGRIIAQDKGNHI